jgi:hypothetical protein
MVLKKAEVPLQCNPALSKRQFAPRLAALLSMTIS